MELHTNVEDLCKVLDTAANGKWMQMSLEEKLAFHISVAIIVANALKDNGEQNESE